MTLLASVLMSAFALSAFAQKPGQVKSTYYQDHLNTIRALILSHAEDRVKTALFESGEFDADPVKIEIQKVNHKSGFWETGMTEEEAVFYDDLQRADGEFTGEVTSIRNGAKVKFNGNVWVRFRNVFDPKYKASGTLIPARVTETEFIRAHVEYDITGKAFIHVGYTRAG